MTKLKNKIAEYRFKHDRMSQDKLAQIVGVARGTINAAENGRNAVGIEIALKISYVFGCTVNDLFYLE